MNGATNEARAGAVVVGSENPVEWLCHGRRYQHRANPEG